MQKRILIIEGAADVRANAQAALEQRDVEVIVADVGRQGVYLAERHQPDAILVATDMPDIDGPRIVRELRANPSTRDIPVIFLESTDGTAAQDGGGTDDGVVGAVKRSLDASSLAARVQQLLGW